MKKLYILVILLLLISGCSSNDTKEYTESEYMVKVGELFANSTVQIEEIDAPKNSVEYHSEEFKIMSELFDDLSKLAIEGVKMPETIKLFEMISDYFKEGSKIILKMDEASIKDISDEETFKLKDEKLSTDELKKQVDKSIKELDELVADNKITQETHDGLVNFILSLAIIFE